MSQNTSRTAELADQPGSAIRDRSFNLNQIFHATPS